MKKFIVMLIALLAVSSSQAWAKIAGQTYSETQTRHTVFEHAEYEYFFNNSGSTLTSGTAVIFDLSGTGVVTNRDLIAGSAAKSAVGVDPTDQTTIGYFITTTTSADSALFVGIVDDDSIADQSMGRVQVYGPRVAIWNDSSDAVTSGSAVGTATTAGRIGGGNGVGVALEAGSGADKSLGWIFIRPGGNN